MEAILVFILHLAQIETLATLSYGKWPHASTLV